MAVSTGSGNGAEDERGQEVAGGPGVGQPARINEDEVGRLARLQAADVVAAQAAGAAAGGHPQHLFGREPARGVGAGAVGEQGLARLRQHVRGVVAGGAVDAQADRHPGVEHVPHRGHARAEAEVRGGAVRDAGAGLAEERDLVAVEVDAVGEPHVGAQPADAAAGTRWAGSRSTSRQ